MTYACPNDAKKGARKGHVLLLSFRRPKTVTLFWTVKGAAPDRLRRFPFKVAAGLQSGRYRRLETSPQPLPASRPYSAACNWRIREQAGYRGGEGTRSFRVDGRSLFIERVASDLANTAMAPRASP